MDFGRILLEEPDIMGSRMDLVHRHAALDSALDGGEFIEAKVDPLCGAEQRENSLQVGRFHRQ